MGWISYVQIFCGFAGLFFGLLAVFTYFKIKRICSQCAEEQLEKIMPMIKKQSRNINIYVVLLIVFTVVSLVLNYVKK